jgi:preprotein translocase subunit YajC
MFQTFSLFPLAAASRNTAIGGPEAGPTPVSPPAALTAPVGSPPAAVTGTSTGPATKTGADGNATQPARDQPSLFSPGNLLLIGMVVVVGYLFLIRPQRKQEQKRKDMLSEMKKGARVMTIGGLIARVVSIDGDEVVLKIDESANVKATYSKRSIQEVLDREEKK